MTDNGGPTPTLALPAISPAVGKADTTNGSISETLDQRGSARKSLAAGRDLGAYERNSLTITGAMPNGTEGVVHAGNAAASGAASFTYAITYGALPPGLSLNPATGTVSGTPTQAGTYSFVITASDGAFPQPNRHDLYRDHPAICAASVRQRRYACPHAARPAAAACGTDGRSRCSASAWASEPLFGRQNRKRQMNELQVGVEQPLAPLSPH